MRTSPTCARRPNAATESEARKKAMKRRSAPKPPPAILVTSPVDVKPLSRFRGKALPLPPRTHDAGAEVYNPSPRSTPFAAPSRSIPGALSRSCDAAPAALPPGTPARLQSTVPSLRLVRFDRVERRDPLAGDGFELFLERRLVVGDELGPVPRAGYLDVERLLRGQVRVPSLHRRDHGIDRLALERVHGRGPGPVDVGVAARRPRSDRASARPRGGTSPCRPRPPRPPRSGC